MENIIKNFWLDVFKLKPSDPGSIPDGIDAFVKKNLQGQILYMALEHLLEVIVQTDSTNISINYERFKKKLLSNNYFNKIPNFEPNGILHQTFLNGTGLITDPVGFGSPVSNMLFSIFLVLRQHIPEKEATETALAFLIMTSIADPETPKNIAEKTKKMPSPFNSYDQKAIETVFNKVLVITNRAGGADKTKPSDTKKEPTSSASDEYIQKLKSDRSNAITRITFMQIGIDVLKERARITDAERNILKPDSDKVREIANAQKYYRDNIKRQGNINLPIQEKLLFSYPNVFKCNTWII